MDIKTNEPRLTFGNGSFPANWGVPSGLYNFVTGKYDNGGMIWYGAGEVTQSDKDEIRGTFPDVKVKIDKRTLCGVDNPDWTTWRTVKRKRPEYKQSIVF